MDWASVLKMVDARTARAFVEASRHLIDAMLIEGERVKQARTPGEVDYGAAELSRATPAGGWISDEELRGVTQRMSEAIAAEKWVDGVVFAMQVMAVIGGGV